MLVGTSSIGYTIFLRPKQSQAFFPGGRILKSLKYIEADKNTICIVGVITMVGTTVLLCILSLVAGGKVRQENG